MTRTARRRPGFTLIELLVAVALCLVIMVSMTYAFQQGMGAFSHAKSLGDLQSRLRTAETTIRTDLIADHLEGDNGPIRVSDVFRLEQDSTGNFTPRRPPRRGFFRVTQESAIGLVAANSNNPQLAAAYQYEGADPDGIASTRAIDHVLHMTVRRSGAQLDQLFTAGVPSPNAPDQWNPNFSPNFRASHKSELVPAGGGVYASPWAEVVYFLDTTNPTGLTATGLPTYTLFRRVRVLPDRAIVAQPPPTASDPLPHMNWASNSDPNPVAAGAKLPDYQGMSYAPLSDPNYGAMMPGRPNAAAGRQYPGMLNDPASVTDPRNRLGGMEGRRVWPASGPLPMLVGTGGGTGYEMANTFSALAPARDAAGVLFGDDIVLSNVLSFEIKGEWVQTGGTVTFPTPTTPATYDYPFDDLPLATRNTVLTSVPKIVPPNVPPPAMPTTANVSRRVFDTWTAAQNWNWMNTGEPTSAPAIIRLRAIRVKVRVYDTKNHLTRQITVIQEM